MPPRAPIQELTPFNFVTFGLATFTTGGGFGIIFNDGQFGSAQYIGDNPQAFGGGNRVPSVIATFDSSADVTALAFTLGADSQDSAIGISIDGSALAPVAVSSEFPTTFFGVTDTSGPICNITFSALNSPEMDLIHAYSTAVVRAPEIDSSSTCAGLMLLFGSLAVARGRRALSA